MKILLFVYKRKLATRYLKNISDNLFTQVQLNIGASMATQSET